MIITKKIKKASEEIDQIIVDWGFTNTYGNIEDKRATVAKWFDNFQPSEFEDALLILKNIQYYNSDIVSKYIRDLSKELIKYFNGDFSKILFYPLGDSPASSGGNFLYTFCKELGVSPNSFPYSTFNKVDLSNIDSIVFFDDMIGSGNQAIEFAKKNLQEIRVNTYYVSLLAFQKGYENVKSENCFNDVIVRKRLSDEYRCFSPQSQIFTDKEVRERIRKMCETYGQMLYPKYPLGYDDSQALIVFSHSTPNNTLPIIWASPDNEKTPGVVWKPLWKRIKKKN